MSGILYLRGQRRIDAAEPRRVVGTEIGRRLHPGEHDAQLPWPAPSSMIAREVLLQLLGRQPAQAVIAAQRDDQHLRLAFANAHSSRRRPPADVSPDTPALTTR